MSTRGMIEAGVGLAAAAYGAKELYDLGGEAYLRDLERRLPPGGLEQSMLPFLEVAYMEAQSEGLDLVLMGGPVKQALCDPETTFDLEKREIIVAPKSDNPDAPECRTRQKDSLYRPEMTLRDADWFVYAIDRFGDFHRADPEFNEKIAAKAEVIQRAVDEYAWMRNFLKGPEISIFNYEEPQSKFRIKHYATVTGGQRDGFEHMSHSLGAKATFTPQERWTFVMDGYRIPTCSPVRNLGRTLDRSLVSRSRDLSDVFDAVDNINNMELYNELLGEEWSRYVNFRSKLDASLHAGRIFEAAREGDFKTAGNIAAALLLAPLAPKIEESWIARKIRDPESKLFKYTSKIMGAKTGNCLKITPGFAG